MRVEILQLPTMLPTTLDPQVRNYFTSFTNNLQFFADQVAQIVNEIEVIVGMSGRAGPPDISDQVAALARAVQQLTDRVTKLEIPPP